MNRTMFRSLPVLCFAFAVLATAAAAEPETPAEGEDADANFAESLLGKTYQSSLEIEGWTDYGGGLVSPPIYIQQYQREDGTSLLITSKQTGQDSYVVTDALLISKPWKGYVISTSCMKGEDFTLRFVGEARGREDQEWWTEVRRAWEVAVPTEAEPQAETAAEAATETAPEAETETAPEPEPGKITKAEPKGVKCASPSW
jgi:hypothetical protein